MYHFKGPSSSSGILCSSFEEKNSFLISYGFCLSFGRIVLWVWFIFKVDVHVHALFVRKTSLIFVEQKS